MSFYEVVYNKPSLPLPLYIIGTSQNEAVDVVTEATQLHNSSPNLTESAQVSRRLFYQLV